jgi:hypothetical protein
VSPESSRDVLLCRGDRAVVASSSQATGLCFRRIENRKLEARLLEKLQFLSCEKNLVSEKGRAISKLVRTNLAVWPCIQSTV